MERSDVHAALEARRELGPAYDDHLVDTLLAKLEQREPASPAALPPSQYPARRDGICYKPT